MANYMIGIDLGATNAKVGIVALSKKTIVRSMSAPLSNLYREPKSVCDLLFSMTLHLLEQTSTIENSANLTQQSITKSSKTVHVITNGIFIPQSSDVVKDSESNSPKNLDNFLKSLNISCNAHDDQVKLSLNDIEGVAVGCPGHIENGIVRAASNFPTWKDVNFAELLEKKFSKPVALNNDADSAIAGEVWAGSAKGRKNVVMITLGSGVGTGLVIGGKLMPGRRGLIEGGHMIVEGKSGRPCSCGQKGCLEQYCSANGIANIAREKIYYHLYSKDQEAMKLKKESESLKLNEKLVTDLPPSPPTSQDQEQNTSGTAPNANILKENIMEKSKSEKEETSSPSSSNILNKIADMPDGIERNEKIEALTTRDIFMAYLQNKDEFAQSIIEECMGYLAIGCINICRMLDPDIILLSGGLTEAGPALIDILKTGINQVGWKILPNDIDIEFASLGSKTGILGAVGAAKLT